MQELIEIRSAPAKLEVNFEALREALEKEVARYDVTVTADTVTEARKLAAELNATAKEIDKRRKEEVAKASEPVRAFDERMRELVKMCTDGRAKITAQIERFDDATRAAAKRLLREAREEFWKDLGVKPEFRRAEFDDLVMVSAMTKAGALASKQKTIIQNRCRDDKQVQDRTERRLLELENASLRAGLSAPLTRHHVEHFLFADDERYSRELERILTAEVERQEQAERAMRERLEREARQKAEAEQRAKERAEREARQKAEAEERARQAQAEGPVKQSLGGLPRDTQWEDPPAEEVLTDQEERELTDMKMQAAREFGKALAAPAPGVRRVRVVAQFEVDAPPGLSDQAIVDECRRVMESAGISTLSDVYVAQGSHEAAGRRLARRIA